MSRVGRLTISALAFLLWALPAEAKPPRDIFGIRLGMSETEAERRLVRLGATKGEAQEAEEEEEAEIWNLPKHRRFAYAYLKVDKNKNVSVVQAYARERQLRYRDLGDLKKARRMGMYIYQWDVPARGKEPALLVTARGTDSLYLGSYSILTRPTTTP